MVHWSLASRLNNSCIQYTFVVLSQNSMFCFLYCWILSHLSTYQSHQILPIYYYCFIFSGFSNVTPPNLILAVQVTTKSIENILTLLMSSQIDEISFILLVQEKQSSKKDIRLHWHDALLENPCWILFCFPFISMHLKQMLKKRTVTLHDFYIIWSQPESQSLLPFANQ